MIFFTPRHVRQGRHFIKDARKLLAYKRDIAAPAVIEEMEAEIGSMEAAVKTKDLKTIEAQAQKLDQVCGKLIKRREDHWLRENVEVFLVAIAVALGVRTYFLQPFTIPTGSMQPTLNGIIGFPTEEPPPNVVRRIVDRLFFGKSWINIVAIDDERFVGLEQRNGLKFSTRGHGILTYTAIKTDKNEYYVDEDAETVKRYFLAPLEEKKGDLVFKKGEPIIRGHVDSGDMVFVDKFSYHFRRPKLAEVFVFNTHGLPTNENRGRPLDWPSQYYIKRLGGRPGDTLRIDPPRLFVNGEVPTNAPMQRVMSGTLEHPSAAGYEGYSNGSYQRGFGVHPMNFLQDPSEMVTLGTGEYFALGDNSYHSSDSRDWGVVPEKNLMGRGVFVYWPFGRHWGLIR